MMARNHRWAPVHANASAFRPVPMVEDRGEVSPEAVKQWIHPQFGELGPAEVYASEESANEDFQF
jgi:hypothetical protein